MSPRRRNPAGFFMWHMNAADEAQLLCRHWRMRSTIILLASAVAIFSYAAEFKPTAQNRIVPKEAKPEMV